MLVSTVKKQIPISRGDPPPGRWAGDARFATTHWSVVLLAGKGSSADAQQALEQLCETYRPALLAYALGLQLPPPDAEDLTQSFFVHLISKNLPGKACQIQGVKFRSFLLRCFKNFLMDEGKRQRAAKRGGDRAMLSLDQQTEENPEVFHPLGGLTPESQFDRRWAAAILEQAMSRLREEHTGGGKPDQFDLLVAYLLEDTRKVDYSNVAAQLGLSRNTVAAGIYRLRKRYRQLVRHEVAQTVGNPDDLEEEMQHLFTVLSR